MRNKKDLAPNRYKTTSTSGSNKFVSSFSNGEITKGIVEKSTDYNWTGYKWSVLFTIVIGIVTFLVLNYLMF